MNRWDAAVFTCMFFDLLGDATADGNLVIYLSDNFGASDRGAAFVVSLMGVAIQLYTIVFASVLDRLPRDGPMGTVIWTNGLGALILAAVVALDMLSRQFPAIRYAATIGAFVILIAFYTLAEALGSMAYDFYIVRSLKPRPGGRTEALMWRLAYGVPNAALAASSGLLLLDRWLIEDARMANSVAMITAAILFAVVAVGAGVLHLKYLRHETALHAPRAAGAETDDGGILPPLAWWRRNKATIGRYYGFKAAFLGTQFAFVGMGASLGKFLIRRFGLARLYPIFLMINPLIMAALAPAMTVVDGWPTRPLLIAGTLLLAAAPLAMLSASLWGVAAAILIATAGEAISMPKLRAYLFDEIGLPRDEIGRYTAIGQLPSLLTGFVLTNAAGALLAAYCPDVGAECHVGMYVWIAGAGALTPLVLLGTMFLSCDSCRTRCRYV